MIKYECFMCKEWFTDDTPTEDIMAEFEQMNGHPASEEEDDNLKTVCDVCFKLMTGAGGTKH